MSLLILNTLDKRSTVVQDITNHLIEKDTTHRIIHTEDMRIEPCVGCNACWLTTPGICALKDDYEQLLKAYLKHSTILLLCDTRLGFIRFNAKNIIDRMLPLGTMYTYILNGQMRHVPRYDKEYRLGLLYSGNADASYLNRWLERVALNFSGVSIGAFPVEKYREILSCT